MQTFHATQPREPRLRVIFGDSAFSFGFSPKTTLADVADWVADIARVHHAAPVAVDVTLAAARPLRLSKGHSHGAH